ncbi:hypothetical protein, partial [uncultured Tateyamaria sp.]|uniref:hypothetical protein n=1 Tax=uncultured Tateyamaria sp. TaxID=455651 RepID=UPI00260966BD
HPQVMWFNMDVCSRVANNVVTFASNSVPAIPIDAVILVGKSRCLQFKAQMIAVRYSYTSAFR